MKLWTIQLIAADDAEWTTVIGVYQTEEGARDYADKIAAEAAEEQGLTVRVRVPEDRENACAWYDLVDDDGDKFRAAFLTIERRYLDNNPTHEEMLDDGLFDDATIIGRDKNMISVLIHPVTGQVYDEDGVAIKGKVKFAEYDGWEPPLVPPCYPIDVLEYIAELTPPGQVNQFDELLQRASRRSQLSEIPGPMIPWELPIGATAADAAQLQAEIADMITACWDGQINPLTNAFHQALKEASQRHDAGVGYGELAFLFTAMTGIEATKRGIRDRHKDVTPDQINAVFEALDEVVKSMVDSLEETDNDDGDELEDAEVD